MMGFIIFLGFILTVLFLVNTLRRYDDITVGLLLFIILMSLGSWISLLIFICLEAHERGFFDKEIIKKKKE